MSPVPTFIVTDLRYVELPLPLAKNGETRDIAHTELVEPRLGYVHVLLTLRIDTTHEVCCANSFCIDVNGKPYRPIAVGLGEAHETFLKLNNSANNIWLTREDRDEAIRMRNLGHGEWELAGPSFLLVYEIPERSNSIAVPHVSGPWGDPPRLTSKDPLRHPLLQATSSMSHGTWRATPEDRDTPTATESRSRETPQESKPKSETTTDKGLPRLLDPIEREMRQAGLNAAAAKTFLSKLLLSVGIEDNDHLYFDGQCDGSPAHRQHARTLAMEAADSLPDDPDVLDALGMALIQSGEYRTALTCYQKQAALAPDSGYAQNNIAWCRLRLQEPQEALKACQKALPLLGTHSHIHHDHASILFQLGKLDEALPIINHAVRSLQPKAPQLHYLKAYILEKQVKSNDAVAAWKRYCKEVKRHTGHHRAVERALARLEALGQSPFRWRRDWLLRRVQPPQITMKPIWEFVGLELPDEKRFAPGGDKWNSDIATSTAKKGWKLLQKQRFSAARRKCDKSLQSWPFSGLGRVLRARLALQEKDYETYAKYVALANLEQIVLPVGEPRCRALAEFVFFMILVHAEKAYHDGDYDAALRQLDEVYRDYPKDPMVIFLRGLILAARGEKEKARSLADSLRGDPQAVSALLRACRDEVPRMSASASSPISSGPSFGSGRYSRFERW